jgi:hypothetical protein
VWSFYINLCKGSTKISFLFIKKKTNPVWSGKPAKPAGYRSKPAGLPAGYRTEERLNSNLNSSGYRSNRPVNRYRRPAVTGNRSVKKTLVVRV